MFPITFTTTMDYQAFEDYYIFSMFRSKSYRNSKGSFFMPYALMISLGFSYLTDELYILAIILLSIATFVITLLGYQFFIAPKRMFKKMGNIFKYPQDFEVFEDHFTVSQIGEDAKGYSHIMYSQVVNVYETHNAFYIFISASQAFIISKQVLTKDEINTISTLFLSIFDKKKFKNCYKKFV
jgi:hypothetical protein